MRWRGRAPLHSLHSPSAVSIGSVNPLVAVGFALIVLGVVGTFALDSQIGYAVIISGWVVLMIDWQRQTSRWRQRRERD